MIRTTATSITTPGAAIAKIGVIAPPPRRRRRSRRASRRSWRPPRPSCAPAPAWSAAAVPRRGPWNPRLRRRRSGPRSARCSSPPSVRRGAGRSPPAGSPAGAGGCRSTTASSRPPFGDDRRLAGDPREGADDRVEPGVDRLDRRLERTQVLGLDALQRGGEGVQPLRYPCQAVAHDDEGDGQHGHDDDRQDHAEDDERVRAHRPSNPSVRAFMYPSWTMASSTISPSTGAVAWSWGMYSVLAATPPATSRRPSTDLSMLRTVMMRTVR